MSSLTKKTEVLDVLEAGGWIVAEVREGHAHGLVWLFNAAGVEVKAWQTAIASNLGNCAQTDSGIWRLR